jgi:hypothetical protein
MIEQLLENQKAMSMVNVKDFTEILKNVKPENQDFVINFLNEMEGIVYDLESTRRELLGGTLKIRMRDLSIVKKAMEDRNIAESDIDPTALKEHYERWSNPGKPVIRGGKERDSGLAIYTVYSRGGIRVLNGSSDAFKFNPRNPEGIESAVEWMKNHYAVWTIQSLVRNITNIDKFSAFKKKYTFEISKIADQLNDVAKHNLEIFKKNYPKAYDEIAPHLLSLAFCAIANGTKIASATGSSLNELNLNLNVPLKNNGSVGLSVTNPWKVGTRKKEVKMGLEIRWTIWGGPDTRWGSGTTLSAAVKDSGDLPSWYLDADLIIRKKEQDLSKLLNDLRGAVAGSRFGV